MRNDFIEMGELTVERRRNQISVPPFIVGLTVTVEEFREER